GTGIVDAVAAMLSLEVLEPTGLMKMGSHPSVDARGLSLDRARGIVLEAADVATVQKAKAAIAATMKTLLAELGIGEQDLQRVFLSGAFGSRLHPGRASAIGLLPAVDPARFVLAGNTARVGASMILLSEKVREAGEDLARKVRHLSVAEDSRFETFFLDSLYFPRPSIRKQAE
ncbi:MAG: DUF4445 domain-containing protein, partial [bacterium]